jgi:glycosyltransferase involved in cell wall biosynthesis
MGKVVIVSESRSMRGYIEPGRNVLSVPVGDAKAMRAALLQALNGAEHLVALRQQAAFDARARFGISGFGRKLSRLLEELIREGAKTPGD